MGINLVVLKFIAAIGAFRSTGSSSVWLIWLVTHNEELSSVSCLMETE